MQAINPKLKIAEWKINIPTTLTTWPALYSSPNRIRRASINSFGYGSSNAHIILENARSHLPPEYDEAGKAPRALGLKRTMLLPFSAITDESLGARVKDLIQLSLNEVNPLDLAHILGSRRSHFRKRGYLLLQPNKPIKYSLAGQGLRTVFSSVKYERFPYAFVFPGQGSQWPQMCKELFVEWTVFRDAISDMDCSAVAPTPSTMNIAGGHLGGASCQYNKSPDTLPTCMYGNSSSFSSASDHEECLPYSYIGTFIWRNCRCFLGGTPIIRRGNHDSLLPWLRRE